MSSTFLKCITWPPCTHSVSWLSRTYILLPLLLRESGQSTYLSLLKTHGIGWKISMWFKLVQWELSPWIFTIGFGKGRSYYAEIISSNSVLSCKRSSYLGRNTDANRSFRDMERVQPVTSYTRPSNLPGSWGTLWLANIFVSHIHTSYNDLMKLDSLCCPLWCCFVLGHTRTIPETKALDERMGMSEQMHGRTGRKSKQEFAVLCSFHGWEVPTSDWN